MRGLTLADPALLGGLGFSPLSLSPALWLDASDTSTITSSGSPAKVSQWNDKSGNGRNVTQAIGAQQPTTGATTFNGLNVLTFDGGDLLGPTSDGISPAANGISVFAVCQNTVDVGFPQNLLSQQDVGGTGRGMIAKDWTGNPSGGAYQTFLGASTTSIGSHDQNKVIMYLFCANGASKTLTFGKNASTTTNTVTLEATSGGYYVGVNKTANTLTCWNGYIAEIILYPSALSVADVSLVRDYLNAKWAVY